MGSPDCILQCMACTCSCKKSGAQHNEGNSKCTNCPTCKPNDRHTRKQ
ncbi:hypothetical protein [Spiroplasma sp. SV19]|nr:hypothetical protein [Spiroplasma sp. SV19]